MTGRAPTDAELVAWQAALDLWNVQLHPPNMVRDSATGTFAWFTFPPSISIDLDELGRQGAEHHLVSVFAHEIGHHVLSPSTRIVSFKLMQQMARAIVASDPRRAIPVTRTARHLSNLWSDLLINDRVVRMQRRLHPGIEPDMIALWRTLTAGQPVSNAAWWVLMRAYELLWSLPSNTLCPNDPPAVPESVREDVRARLQVDPAALDVSTVRKDLQDKERAHRAAALRVQALQDELLLSQPVQPVADAEYLAQAVRTFGADPVGGALTFGMVLVPYLVLESMIPEGETLPGGGCAEQDGAPATATELAQVLADPRLDEPPIHPAAAAVGASVPDQAPGQSYGVAQTLALFSGSDPNAVMLAWYEAQARPWIRPLLQSGRGVAEQGIPGPLETWELGDDATELDWPATLAVNPVVVPGVTTRRRTQLPDDPVATTEAVTLDLYIDSSGSMPHPDRGSSAVLAGMILVLSVLKGGGRVRVTSWSGRGQVAGDSVYTRDRLQIMRQLTTFFGGGTVFPLDLLADRYPPGERDRDELRHLVVLSDDGLMSLFGSGQEEYAGVAAAVRRQLATATLLVQDRSRSVAAPAAEAGYGVDYLDNMADAPAVCARLAAHIAGYRREVLHG
ncbi:VWA domain-containing protein [Mycolicibacterium porcinum]|uniref:VWA domain-containing protein n=1 Tax=Mycolicibacterium porcinum TaxID=39693 RepID=UPI001192EE3C|nr:VWA domain-containing protein [Mycolicibacterium porcinum]TVY02485.1 VWA domain-containing protein [Mycolicibacterium porcinum]